MNLAFPVLCILLLALPGVLFRKAFARAAVSMPSYDGVGRYKVNKYPVSIRPISEEIGLSLVWTIVLHAIWLNFFGLFVSFDHQHLIKIIHGSSTIPPIAPVAGSTVPPAGAAGYGEALEYLAKNLGLIFVYLFSLYVVSFAAGRGCLELVRHNKLDHELMVVRLQDHWFYFLWGEIFKFSEFRRLIPDEDSLPEVCGTYVSVVVAQSGTDYLYKGFLWDFDLDRDGKLDRLVLHHAIRTPFTPGSAGAEGMPMDHYHKDVRIDDGHWNFQRVSSQLFTVRYADCKTLACTYFYIRQKKEKKKTTQTAIEPTIGTSREEAA